MDIAKILRSPLMESGRPGNFLRLCLAETANYGVPGHILATLDDLAAMLGLYDPLPKGPAEHLASPFTMWRTHPSQPTMERVHDVEKLAYAQRATIAFGGGRSGETVGTGEILIACGNILKGESPPEYFDVFTWAALDCLRIITGETTEKILSDPGKRGWTIIPDKEVLIPGGRLYQTYQTIATSIRRDAIAALSKDSNPRARLLPFARQFLEANARVRATAIEDGNADLLAFLDKSDLTIRTMFPTLAEEHIEPERVSF
jgi:hypothetical protein